MMLVVSVRIVGRIWNARFGLGLDLRLCGATSLAWPRRQPQAAIDAVVVLLQVCHHGEFAFSGSQLGPWWLCRRSDRRAHLGGACWDMMGLALVY
jgi:hypothetical protein